MRRNSWMIFGVVMLWSVSALAANTVVVPSMSVAKGATGVVIPVMITNEVPLKSVLVPLVFRAQTPGAFVTSIAMGFGDRLPVGGPISAITFRNQYAEEDGVCKDAGPGGFGTISSATGGPNPVTASPEAVFFVRQKLFESGLTPGADVTGSMLLTVDVTSVDGTFEIDTTCTNPANHLLFVEDPTNAPYIPGFAKGIITVGNPTTNQPPVAVCQDVTVEAGPGCQTAVAASQVNNGSSDPDGDPLTFALVPPGPYTLGVTPVILIVTDDKGDADTCNATITVQDTTDPVIASCPGDISVQCIVNIPSPSVAAVTATDNCSVTITFQGDASDGGSCPETITRTYRATDASGNYAECTQTITVDDTEPPVAHCPNDIHVTVGPGETGAVVNFTSTVSDNCVGATITCVPPSGSAFPLGATTVTCTATDACGNTDECSFAVTVTEGGGNEPPVAVNDDFGARGGVRLFVVGAGCLTNDYDPDGGTLTAILVTDVSHGALTLSPNGSFMYTPVSAYNGLDQFTYYANDGSLNSTTPATVTLHVKSGPAVVPGDYDEDGYLTAIDMGRMIDALWIGGADPHDGGCDDSPRGDYDGDGFTTSLDFAKLVDHLFAGGAGPVDPCDN